MLIKSVVLLFSGLTIGGLPFSQDLGYRYIDGKCLNRNGEIGLNFRYFGQCSDLRDVIPFDCIPVCVELADGARSLVDFTHPQRAFYIFGPEDGSIPKEITERYKIIVQVPTDFCMNLAATVNVVLYDRWAKEMRT